MNVKPKLALTRRLFLASAPLALAGCASSGRNLSGASLMSAFSGTYGDTEDNGIMVPGIDTSSVDPRFLRQTVEYTGRQSPGTIVIDTPNRQVYLVGSGRKATRYGCGVGRSGAEFRGNGYIGRTAVWPHWAPTKNMLAVMPERYGPVRGGMAGGINNPLGARAMYLYGSKGDLMYRIHGSNEPDTIGQAVSSGCIRMLNDDVVDLYNRVGVGTRVKVLL
jgi:lipoprotein-anchoring transpeptidase ErfK/SrfK